MSHDAAETPRQNAKHQYVSARINGVVTIIIGTAALFWMTASYWWLTSFDYWWSTLAVTVAAGGMIFGYMRPQLRLPARDDFHTRIAESLLTFDPVSLMVLDRTGRIIELNESTSQLLGYRKQELMGKKFFHFVDESSRQQAMDHFNQTLLGEVQEMSVSTIHNRGYSLDIHVKSAPITQNGRIVGTVMISRDLSDRMRNLERIRYMAYYDDMTGLPNRRSFMMHVNENLGHSKSMGRKPAVLYLDVDRFKLINASLGRDFGDMLLMQVAERLTRGLPEPDIAARMEGDEFAVLYTDAGTEEELLGKAKAVLHLIEEPFELQGVPLHVTGSIGIAVSTSENDDAAVLLKKADMALAKVKDSGKNNCVIYSDEWDNSSLARLTLQHELKRAVQRKEFVLYYQPQYHLMTGEIVGIEALVRWEHPSRGIVGPGQFIPLAEESGIIMEIGDWVLEEACRQNKAWQEAGLPPVLVSVNLSIRQFLQQDLTQKVADILARTGLEARYLDLEITETMTMDVAHATSCLLELTKLGVHISIDDFGTGYSSLHYLKNLPIGRLKIDRSFVSDIENDPGDAAIVAAIIAMAHSLQLQVIAEGVETEVQMKFLQKHLCDEMQGFLWSPPVPGSDMQTILYEMGGR